MVDRVLAIGGIVIGLMVAGLGFLWPTRWLGWACIASGLLIFVVSVTWAIARHSTAVKESALETELPSKTETFPPELHGNISQVHIASDGLVCIELSVWNRNKMPTSVRRFGVRIITPDVEYLGMQIDITPNLSITTGFNKERPLKQSELPFKPLPDGYKQGLIERDCWLCFVLTSTHPRDLQDKAMRVVVTAIDVFGIRHEISREVPFAQYGKIVRH